MTRPAIDELRRIETSTEVAACHPLMQQLRPHLGSADELVARWQAQAAEGYRMAAIWRGDTPVALAGYRVQHNLVHGRFLYVDDLVTREEARSSGLGRTLLDWLKAEGRTLDCAKLVLDTPLSNSLGQRFYFRNGLLANALRFNQPL
jgi:ribosomal protein S18 acetylase RimI-like enzyme